MLISENVEVFFNCRTLLALIANLSRFLGKVLSYYITSVSSMIVATLMQTLSLET